jgi:hypothetical protein
MSSLIRFVVLLQLVLGVCSFQMTPRSRSVNSRLQMSDVPLVPLVTIGTRGSPLALAQAYETKRLLGLAFSELLPEGAVEIKKIMTKVSSAPYRHCLLCAGFCSIVDLTNFLALLRRATAS